MRVQPRPTSGGLRDELPPVLIANREIASRIIRTCIQGIDTVSGPRSGSRLRAARSRRHHLVAAGRARSYLDVAAVSSRAGHQPAIHPGYGFLAENVRLARACADAGLVFIGATERQLELMGDKLAARSEALAAGLPIVPGGAVTNVQQARGLAEELGYPLLIKAVGGGGGRGIKGARQQPGRGGAELATAEAGRLAVRNSTSSAWSSAPAT
jgi:acetyl-CoA carboxylase biotin carboxylase subunit